MAQQRIAVLAAPTFARRTAAASERHADRPRPVAAAASLQQQIGHSGVRALLARAAAAPGPAPPGPASLRVSQPNDPAELEAHSTAQKVMRMAAPSPPAVATPPDAPGTVQRSAAASESACAPSIASSGGRPLPPSVRGFMEPRFCADFSSVRIHTDEAAAQSAAQLGAHAFTVGNQIHFGRGKFQPDAASGRELIAHELTHTIQQGGAVQRSVDPSVTHRTAPHVQRWGFGDVLDYAADKARFIPGFRLLTVVLGMNPINMAPVERSAANILRGLLELVPITGPLVVQALETYGLFARLGGWIEARVRMLALSGGMLRAALDKFIGTLSLGDAFDLGGVWERAKRIFTEPIERMAALGASIVGELLGFIREAILLPLARLAEGMRGYDLLKAVLGEDPVTGQKVPRTPETLIGGFMKLIGEEETWENLKKSNAVPRAWAWFQSALAGLMGFVRQVPRMFMDTLRSLEIADLLWPAKAFLRAAGAFGNFALQFVTWAGNALWTLLEIIFEVVSPATLAYLRKTGAALKGILKDPQPFMRNLVRAAKLGFQNFADNFGTHLKRGLIEWLTGALPGVYIPKAFSLVEIGKFTFSVLGLTWKNIRPKLVKALPGGETTVKVLETTFDIVMKIATDPGSVLENIKEQLTELKDTVIGAVVDFVTDIVVHKAVPKLISMFIPGAGFVSAILSIYETVMVFVRKLSAIAQVVKSFVDSVVAIAAGQIEGAAKRVESTLAGFLSIAVSFLMGFVLGDVSSKVMGVITKLRETVDKAVDALIAWVVKMASALVGKVKAGVKALFDWAFSKSEFEDEDGHQHTLYVDAESGTPRLVIKSTPTAAAVFLDRYLERRGPDFVDANKAGIAAARTAIGAAEKQVEVIDKAKKAGKSDEELMPANQQLLTLNVAVTTALSALINNDATLGKWKEKYLLEGLCGTYGSIPKPKGDSFTADHQPQAAVLEAAAELAYFDEGGQMVTRAAGRAKLGFAINVHFKRHTAGRTYGGKGGSTKKDFLKAIASKVKPKENPKQAVVNLIKAELNEDVKVMKAVAKDKANYPDIAEDKSLKPKERQVLIEEIGDRLIAGENQMAAQDIDGLVD